MRIIQEPKLNFEDVLLCPKRSTLTSRADVKMTRTFKFRNSQGGWFEPVNSLSQLGIDSESSKINIFSESHEDHIAVAFRMFKDNVIIIGDCAFTARPHAGMGVTKAALDCNDLTLALKSMHGEDEVIECEIVDENLRNSIGPLQDSDEGIELFFLF